MLTVAYIPIGGTYAIVNPGTGELISRDRATLDIFRLKDESLENPTNLHAPDMIVEEIVANLAAALEQSPLKIADLGKEDISETIDWEAKIEGEMLDWRLRRRR